MHSSIRFSLLLTTTLAACVETAAPTAGEDAASDEAAVITSTGACTAGQTAQIQAAVTKAIAQASSAFADISLNAAGPNYRTWFGDPTRFDLVAKNAATFNAIFFGLNSNLDFNCVKASDVNCTTASTVAYVFPGSAYKINLCPPYFTILGSDAQAATLVHEMSHFRIVANTTDAFAGSSASAKKLAASAPDQAAQSAKNVEFFALSQLVP